MSYHRIFISYRRKGGDVSAKLVSEALKNRGYTTFYDYDALKGGTFDKRIRQEVIDCTDMVLVLPPNALDRCESKDDWVRMEIALALQHGKNIIPVMLDGFQFPEDLPEDIAQVRYYNGVRFHMEFFDAVIDRIIEKLSFDLNAKQEQEPVAPPKKSVETRIPDQTPAARQESPQNTEPRGWLAVSAATVCLLAAFLLAAVGFFFLSEGDVDLMTMCLLTGVAALYAGYVCASFASNRDRQKRLLMLFIIAAALDAGMLILGFSVARPYLLYCEAPYLLFVSLLGALFFLLRQSPEDSLYIFPKIKIRKKTFVVAYTVFATLASLILFLLVFTLGFFSDLT